MSHVCEDYGPFLARLLKEIELDAVHGHEDNDSAIHRVLNDLGGEMQERLNSGEWTDIYRVLRKNLNPNSHNLSVP